MRHSEFPFRWPVKSALYKWLWEEIRSGTLNEAADNRLGAEDQNQKQNGHGGKKIIMEQWRKKTALNFLYR